MIIGELGNRLSFIVRLHGKELRIMGSREFLNICKAKVADYFNQL